VCCEIRYVLQHSSNAYFHNEIVQNIKESPACRSTVRGASGCSPAGIGPRARSEPEQPRLSTQPPPTAPSDNAADFLEFSYFHNGLLVLLCYKNPRRQQGQRGRERARWVAIWRRRVAMECGLCRSVRTGSASGRVVGLYTG
jgi:hypothetical protein